LEVCCHVNSTDVNCHCHCSTVVTTKISIGRMTEFRHICYYLLCVKFAVLT
jgi:hypothetical protein